MLRIHFLRHRFELSDANAETAPSTTNELAQRDFRMASTQTGKSGVHGHEGSYRCWQVAREKPE